MGEASFSGQPPVERVWSRSIQSILHSHWTRKDLTTDGGDRLAADGEQVGF